MHLRTKIIRRRHRTKKIKRGWRPSDQYVGNLDEKLNEIDIQSLSDLGKILVASANATTPDAIDEVPKPWQYDDVKH